MSAEVGLVLIKPASRDAGQIDEILPTPVDVVHLPLSLGDGL